MEEERDLVTFTDEDGNEFDLEVIDYLEHEGEEYATLIDPEQNEDEDVDLYIMHIAVNEEENIEEFLPVEDDALLDELMELFERHLTSDAEEFETEDEAE